MTRSTLGILALPVLLFLVIFGSDVLWPQPATSAVVDDTPVHVEAPEGVKGRYEIRGNQRILTLWGTPYERGYAQGYLLAEVIVRGIEHDFDRVLKPFIPTYESVVRRGVVPKFAFTPREIEEMEGLQAGLEARLPPEKRIIKGFGRPFDLTDIKALNTFGDWYGLGCSSLAAWGRLTKNGRPLVGRNFDFPGFYLLVQEQYVVVRAADGDAQGQVGVAYPGCVGTLTGMNTAGVFVAVHDVRIKPSLDKAMRPNVPRLLAVRRILEQTTGAEACNQALALARTWPTLYGNNVMVVAPEAAEGVPHAAVLEYDCRLDMEGGCTMRIADGAGGADEAACLTCTNHHRQRAKPEGYVDLYERWRFPVLAEIGDGDAPEGERLDVESMFQRMNRVAFPREGVQAFATAVRGPNRAHGTLHQTVGEPAEARLHIRLGAVGKHIRAMRPVVYDVRARVRHAGR